MPPSSSAHLEPPTEHGRAEAEKVGHLSLDFHGFWLQSSGAKSRTWTHVLSHRVTVTVTAVTNGRHCSSWLWLRCTETAIDTLRDAGRRPMPDTEPQSRSVTLLCRKMRSRRAASNKVGIVTFMSPAAVCGPFCGCLSGSALAADGAAKEQSQSPPRDLLKPLGGGPSVTLWRLERRCATRCGAAARDRDGGWRDQTAAPGCDYGVQTPCGVRAAAWCPILSRSRAPLHFFVAKCARRRAR